MRILFEPRSKIFDFTIACAEGRVRFTDLQGQQYTLHAGQRLGGAGSRMTPSVEVGEITKRSLEQMQLYHHLASQYSASINNLTHYLGHLHVIEQTASRTYALPPADKLNSVRRPIGIEYAKEPDPVTPFRGEVKPPSADQADLF